MKNYLFILSYFNKKYEMEVVCENKTIKLSDNMQRKKNINDFYDFTSSFILSNKDKDTNFSLLLISDKLIYKRTLKKEIGKYLNPSLFSFKLDDKKKNNKQISKLWLINKELYDKFKLFYQSIDLTKKNIYPCSYYFLKNNLNLINTLDIYLFNTTILFLYYDEEGLKIEHSSPLNTSLIIDLKEKIIPSNNTIKYNPKYFTYLDQITTLINHFLRFLYLEKIEKVIINNYNYVILRDINYLIGEVDHEKIEFS